jgi:hypothetical protein
MPMTKTRSAPVYLSADRAFRIMVVLNLVMGCMLASRLFAAPNRPGASTTANGSLATLPPAGMMHRDAAALQWLPSDFERMFAQPVTTLPLTNSLMSSNLMETSHVEVPQPVTAGAPASAALPTAAIATPTQTIPPAPIPAAPITTPSGCVVASGSAPALRAIVMTGGTRVASLNRLLRSLIEADAVDDRIDIDVWIDVPNSDHSSAEYLEREALARDVRALKTNGTYTHGEVRAFVWGSPSGLRKQWLETWDRSTPCGLGEWTSEIGLILEDDLELSPHFWRWLKGAHGAYGKDPRVAGFTLQRASLCAKMCDDLLGGPSQSPAAFFYPLVGSWGYSPTVAHWIRFRKWYYDFIQATEKPYVEGLKPTEWYRSFEKAGTAGKRMWTMHHIKYVDTHEDKYTVYVKCPNNRTMSQNHLEAGINYATKRPSDHERLLDWDDSLLTFPKSPIELDWEGKQTGGQGDAGGFLQT